MAVVALTTIAHRAGAMAGSFVYQWSISDQLGNLRVSLVLDTSNKAQVVQSQDYDPWGWQL